MRFRVQVINVEGLGHDPALVTVNAEKLLLIESTLDVDTWIEMMSEAMAAAD